MRGPKMEDQHVILGPKALKEKEEEIPLIPDTA